MISRQCKQNSISISYWNVQGIINKIQDTDFLKNITHHDIIGLGETWLTTGNKNMLNLSSYYDYSVVRKNNKRGGVSILIKKSIKKGIKIINSNNVDTIWCKLEKQFFNIDKDLYICFIYNPPENSIHQSNSFFDQLEKLAKQRVGSASDVLEFMRKRSPGEDLQVQVTRGDQTIDVTIRLQPRPGG